MNLLLEGVSAYTEHVTNYFAVFSERVVKCFDSTLFI